MRATLRWLAIPAALSLAAPSIFMAGPPRPGAWERLAPRHGVATPEAGDDNDGGGGSGGGGHLLLVCHCPPGAGAPCSAIAVGPHAAAAHLAHGDAPGACSGAERFFARRFAGDPLGDPDLSLAGAALARVAWQPDVPAFEGDVAGSLRAHYDASLPAGLFGFRLPAGLTQDDAFTAGALFVIDPDGFAADPDGFFQIAWGLWNQATTGLDRTGDSADFAADTFESVAFDWFPNVSPLFGGPFLAPAVFGVAAPDQPSFDALGAFANFSTTFGLEADLPRGVPLLAVIEHNPAADGVAVQVWRVAGTDRLVPLSGAVSAGSLTALSERTYTVDTVGLMLWHDGFGGPVPAVEADLDFHGLFVEPGLLRPEALIDASAQP